MLTVSDKISAVQCEYIPIFLHGCHLKSELGQAPNVEGGAVTYPSTHQARISQPTSLTNQTPKSTLYILYQVYIWS